MPKALSRAEVELQRLLAKGNWYQSGQNAINSQLSRLGVSGTAQAGNIDWAGVTRGFFQAEMDDEEEKLRKERSRFYNNYYKQLAGPNGGRPNYGSSDDLESLYRRVQDQRRTAERTGGDTTDGPSFLSRIFDLLSRGNYATAEGTKRVMERRDTESPEDSFARLRSQVQAVGSGNIAGLPFAGVNLPEMWEFLKGAVSGAAGKDKTTYGEVLKEQGPERLRKDDLPARAIRGSLGFAGDVALDPLNFFGGSIVKNAGKEAIERAGKEAVEKAFTSPQFKKIGYDAVRQATKANKGRVLPRAKQLEVFNDAVAAPLAFVSKHAREQAAEIGKGRFALSVLGTEIGTSSGIGKKLSTEAYQRVAELGKYVADSPIGATVNQAFRTRAGMPGLLHRYARMFHGRGVSDLHKSLKRFRDELAPLTKKESELITRALADGTDLTGMLSGKGDIDLQDTVVKIRAMLDGMYTQEVAMGFKEPKKYMSNYIPHYAEWGPVANQKKWHDAVTMGIDEARDLGIRPITDIRELVARRATRYFQKKTEYDLVKSLADEFGVQALKKGSTKLAPNEKTLKTAGLVEFKHKTINPKKVGKIYVPPPVMEFMGEMKKMVSDPEYAQDILHLHDRLLNTWKTMATVVNPGFHVRNTIGDVFLNWLAGVRDIKSYNKAAKVMRGGKGTVVLGGHKVPLDDVMYLYQHAGLNVGFFSTEIGRTIPGTKKIREWSEAREQWARLTHFVDKLDKAAQGKKFSGKLYAKDFRKQMTKIAEAVGDDVRKFNIDYGDLTPFEKNVGKRLVPFYTWIRKSTPLLLEALFLQPGKISKIPKGQRAIQTLLGTDEPTNQKVEDMIPKWILDYSSLRIGGGDEPTFVGAGSVLPIQFLGEFSSPNDVTDFAANSMNPLLQILQERASGEDVFTGGPIEDNPVKYAADMTPLTRLIGKGVDPDQEVKGRDLINYLLGVGYQNVDENRKKGELYRQERELRDLLSGRKKNLEKELTR